MQPRNINTVTGTDADILFGYRRTDGKASTSTRGWPRVYPGQFGAVKGDSDDLDNQDAFDAMIAFAEAADMEIAIDGIYRVKGQLVLNNTLRIAGVTEDAKIISQIGTNSGAFLVFGSNVGFFGPLEFYRDYRDADGVAGDPAGPFGTIFTVGRTAYATAPTEPQRNVFFGGVKLTRNEDDRGNNISVSGWVDTVTTGAEIFGTLAGGSGEAIGVSVHWGAHESLTDIVTYSYHPTNINLNGLVVHGAGLAVSISSSGNVFGHYTSIDSPKALLIVPGDNALDYVNPDQDNGSIGAGIDISLYATGATPNKAIYITGMGNSPFDGELHMISYSNIQVKAFIEFATGGSADEQAIDIENMIGTGRFSFQTKGLDQATGLDVERVVGRFVFDGCVIDSKRKSRFVRNKGIMVQNSEFTRPRFIGSVATTHGLEIFGEAIAKTLGADMTAGDTTITLVNTFGVRVMPGDAIDIVQSGLTRTVYAANVATDTATVITIRPSDFSALATDPGTAAPAVVTLRTDIADTIIQNNLFAGHYYGIGLNRGLGSSFKLVNVHIEKNTFREIGNQGIAAKNFSQGSIRDNSDRDGGVGRVINGSLTTRFIDFDTSSNVNVEGNFINANSSPNQFYGIVNNAASSRLHYTHNRFGQMQAGADTNAFSAGSAASQLFTNNYYLLTGNLAT